jgi:hypothetical protein
VARSELSNQKSGHYRSRNHEGRPLLNHRLDIAHALYSLEPLPELIDLCLQRDFTLFDAFADTLLF